MATKMYVECVEKPSKEEFTTTDITVGKVYPVKWVDHNDYQIVDDKKKVRYYRQKFFKDAETYISRDNKELTGYPTQKPKELIKRLVLASTNEGDTVADYYLGSGTTAVCCQELNRNFIGCDINERAIELTKNRIKLLKK